MQSRQEQVKVWDPIVRIGHWTLAAAFLIAYFTAEELENVHVAAGYWVGGYVIARTVWGFVGSPHARFSDFVRGPKAVLSYLSALLRGRSPRYLGHNPAGGAMIVSLLICLAATVFTGLAVEADAENEGPLAGWLGHSAPAPIDQRTQAAASNEAGEGSAARDRESRYEDIHEFFANLTLVLVALHLLGVIADTWIHRENIVRAMITGYKTKSIPPSESAPGNDTSTPRPSR
jgi:cytochrome b